MNAQSNKTRLDIPDESYDSANSVVLCFTGYMPEGKDWLFTVSTFENNARGPEVATFSFRALAGETDDDVINRVQFWLLEECLRQPGLHIVAFGENDNQHIVEHIPEGGRALLATAIVKDTTR